MKKIKFKNIFIYLFIIYACLSASLFSITLDLSFLCDKTAVGLSGSSPVMWVGAAGKDSDGNLLSAENPLAKVIFSSSANSIESLVQVLAEVKNTYIEQLTLLGGVYPVFTVHVDQAKPIEPVNVWCHSIVDNKTVVIKNSKDIKFDTTTVKNIGALAASGEKIYCACGEGSNKWGSVFGDSGIVILKKSSDAKTLEQVSLKGPGDTEVLPQAAKISFSAKDISIIPDTFPKRVVAFYSGGENNILAAEAGSDVTLYWDSVTSRLYIGLWDVKRDTKTCQGGVCALLVCRWIDKDKTEFKIEPVVKDIKKELLYDEDHKNSCGFINGFYLDGTDINNGNKDISVSVKKICELNTSTGKHYLLVNSVISKYTTEEVEGEIVSTKNDVANGVYALPVMQAGGDDSVVGKIASVVKASGVADFTHCPVEIGEMPRDNQVAIKVGSSDYVGPDFSQLKDMYAYGDTVYVSTISSEGVSGGIFKSLALFNDSGLIIGWTPWQRVWFGISDVIGGGVDTGTGNIFGVTAVGASSKAVVSGWDSSTTSETSLQKVLSDIFQDDGGVRQVFNFDEYTPGFWLNKFSMVVALGYSSVAIVVTGKSVDDKFTPVTEFSTSGETQNVFVYKGDTVLKEIAPLCVAEVARNNGDAVNTLTGWLFVGGAKGLAVLSDAVLGTGWLTYSDAGRIGLGNTDYNASDPLDLFKEEGKDYLSWKQLKTEGTNVLTGIRGLVSDGTFLNVMTAESLISVKMLVDSFKNEAALLTDSEDGYKIASVDDLSGVAYSDICLVHRESEEEPYNIYLLATTGGLYVAKGTRILGYKSYRVPSIGDTPVIQLYYLSTSKGVLSNTGNLYVLVADYANNSGKIYRFYVDGMQELEDVVKPIGSDEFINFTQFRYNFATDGTVLWDLCPSVPNNKALVKLYEIGSPVGSPVNLTSKIGIDSNKYADVRGIVFNTAGGEWVISGDFGVTVNKI